LGSASAGCTAALAGLAARRASGTAIFKHGQFTKEVIAARKLWKPAWRQVTKWQRDQALDRDTVLVKLPEREEIL